MCRLVLSFRLSGKWRLLKWSSDPTLFSVCGEEEDNETVITPYESGNYMWCRIYVYIFLESFSHMCRVENLNHYSPYCLVLVLICSAKTRLKYRDFLGPTLQMREKLFSHWAKQLNCKTPIFTLHCPWSQLACVLKDLAAWFSNGNEGMNRRRRTRDFISVTLTCLLECWQPWPEKWHENGWIIDTENSVRCMYTFIHSEAHMPLIR